MSAPDTYDAIVIGSGRGGTPLAEAFAAKGRTTALVEREHVGGTCVNTGCTPPRRYPTKTMIASGRIAYLARRAADYGVRVQSIDVDMRAVRARKRGMVAEWRDPETERLKKTEHLDLLFGEGRFRGIVAHPTPAEGLSTLFYSID
jgi:pyruvate/2-oxoglutarate dehydrogenase complex dihydrolipoamide dehydrogenase (E3) component